MNTPRKTMVVSLLASAALSLSVGLFAAEPESENSVQESSAQPPTSMESAIERRREMLEKRRERYRDARSGRFWRQPPWVAASEEWFDQREEAMDEQFRRRRDAAEAGRDAWQRWQNPWTAWHRERAEARRNAMELERLRREEALDRRYYARPWFR